MFIISMYLILKRYLHGTGSMYGMFPMEAICLRKDSCAILKAVHLKIAFIVSCAVTQHRLFLLKQLKYLMICISAITQIPGRNAVFHFWIQPEGGTAHGVAYLINQGPVFSCCKSGKQRMFSQKRQGGGMRI